MKICILSRSPRAYSTRRLKEAATSRGYQARAVSRSGRALRPTELPPMRR